MVIIILVHQVVSHVLIKNTNFRGSSEGYYRLILYVSYHNKEGHSVAGGSACEDDDDDDDDDDNDVDDGDDDVYLQVINLSKKSKKKYKNSGEVIYVCSC